MVAGGFVKDLEALGDRTPHDERYARLAEYAALVTALLRNETVSHEGRYYALANLKLAPEMPAALLPRIFMSGSSGAGAEAAARIGAVPVNYPPPPEQIDAPFAPGSFARVGIIAREHAATAWQIAHARFPKDPRGRMTHRLATAISDSVWHKRLAELGDALEKAPESTYWLHPFQTYRTFCPYLVGSHAEVAAIIRRYQSLGIEGYILDVPQTLEDLPNTVEVFRRAGGAADAGAIAQERAAGGQAS
jgi:alkanesulfonate monooxygenase